MNDAPGLSAQTKLDAGMSRAGTRAGRLSALMNARRVAIVGASADPSKITGRPLAYMLARQFAGKLFPVNAGRSEVQGLPSFKSLGAIGEPVDLALIGTNSSQVEGVVAEGIAAGIKAFVVFSSGFGETGAEGRALQDRLRQMAREAGVTIVGPNCLGVANSATGLLATFTTALEETPLRRGGFALASQSGALAAYWMDIVLRSGLGFSQWISTGNECDVDVAEAVDFLVDDPHTRVIAIYLEEIRDTLAFRRAIARAAGASKPVIAIKSGRSQAGAMAAASHTGALAGDDALYDACLRQHGALRVDSLTEMIDVARLFLFDAVPQGTRLAVMSVSGGAGVMIADEADRQHLSLPSFSEATCSALRQVLPSFTHPANPLDVTGQVVQDSTGISRALEAVASDPNIDVIVLFVGMMHSIAEVFTRAVAAVRERTGRSIVVVWTGAMPRTITVLEASRIPVFTDIPPAVQALAAATRAVTLQQAAVQASQLPRLLGSAPHQPRAVSEWDGKQLLRSQSAVEVPPGSLLGASAEPSPLPPPLRYPVAAKLQSVDLLHKSEAGGVALHIASDAELGETVRRLRQTGIDLGLPMQGVLVEQMVAFDHELLLGLRRDLRFGPVLTIGRGGVEVELDPDTVTRLLPIDAKGVESMLRSLRSARLLEGYRGRPASDIPAIAARIAELSEWFARNSALQEVEINPLAVRGSRVFALDALVTQGVRAV